MQSRDTLPIFRSKYLPSIRSDLDWINDVDRDPDFYKGIPDVPFRLPCEDYFILKAILRVNYMEGGLPS